LPKSAIVAGATGLVGSRLLAVLLADPDYDTIHALVRRPLGIANAKLCEHPVDYGRLNEMAWPVADDVFCCLGTTIRVAGSQEAFREVDYVYPLAVARAAQLKGAEQFLFVSAMGADARSSVFYSRVKGELEVAIAALGYRAAIALRPSLLSGQRRQQRLGERAALMVLQPLRSLVPRRYRPVADEAVARAMVAYAKRGLAGFHVVPSDAIQAFAPG